MTRTGDSFEAILRAVAHSPELALPFGGTTRYRLGRRLGEGGFGVVYECLDRVRGERVALKVLRDGEASSLYRFKREFRSLCDLAHPHVVRLFELGCEEGTWFFTMELLDGLPFDEWVDRDPSRLRQALLGLCRGLVALHGAGKLHRDLKPSNVLVTREGRSAILDFGLVGEAAHEQSVVLAGTPLYMSPEQGEGQRLDAASDWYAVGVMLFEALTGVRPFEGDAASVLTRKRSRDAPRASSLAPDVPPDLDALCADLLARDPGARPRGEAVLARLGSVVAAPHGGSGRERFVGRETELAALASELEAVRGGGSRLVLVPGASGIGKSALLRRLAELARSSGALVLSGRCYPREALRFKALDAVVDELVRLLAARTEGEVAAVLPRDVHALGRLFPVVQRLEGFRQAPKRPATGVEAADGRRAGAAALRELCSRLGDRRPLVVCVDDLQWGDADSAALLGELLRPPDGPRLLFVGGYRTESAQGPLLAALAELQRGALADVPCRTLSLAELSPEDATVLARELLMAHGADPDDSARLASESRGHPFFLQELAREPLLTAEAPSLERLVAHRIERLDERTAELLAVVAVSGVPVEERLALQAAALHDGALAAIDELRRGGLVTFRTHGSEVELECYHDRVREIALAALPAARRRRLHARIAATLEADASATPERLGHHLREAGHFERAAECFDRAARAASDSLAFDQAVELLQEALALRRKAGLAEPPRELWRRLGDACAGAGRCSGAADAFLSAAAVAHGLGAVELQRRAAEQLLVGGHLERGKRVLAAVLQALGLRLPDTGLRALATLATTRVALALRAGRFTERPASSIAPEELLRIDTLWTAGVGSLVISPMLGSAALSQHAVRALRAGEIQRVMQAATSEALVSSYGRGLAGAGHTARSLVLARRLSARVDSEDAALLVATTEAAAALFEGRPREALAHAERALARRPASNYGFELPRAECIKHNVLFWMGRVGDSARELPALVEAMRERGNLLGWTWLSLYASWNAAVTGATEAMHERIEAALAPWTLRGLELQAWWRVFAHVHGHLLARDGRAAHQTLEEVWPALRRGLLLEGQMHRIEARWLRARTMLARAMAEPWRGRDLLAQVESDATRIEREHTAWGDAHARQLRACVALGRRDTAGALRLLRSADGPLQALGFEAAATAGSWLAGGLVGGGEGRALRREAERWMLGQGIASPERWTGVYLPVAPWDGG